MNKNSLITIAGILWGLIGLFLIYRGIGLYQLAVNEQHSTQNALIFSVIAGLALGGVKGRFVLSKTARKNKTRIEQLDAPLKIHHIFSKPFYGFIALMILLGIMLRQYNELFGGYIVVAAVYCGIGMGLMVGSRAYWKTEPETAIKEVQ